MLFLGGPAHGQVMEVRADMREVRVPMPPGSTPRDEHGLPILTGFDTAVYLRRQLEAPAADGTHFARSLFVEAGLQPQQAEQLLGGLLIQLWVLSGEQVG